MSCYQCQDRHLGCHDPEKCEKYAAFLEEHYRAKGKADRQKQSMDEINSYVRYSKERYKRRMGKK